jgi:hypothetical protein
MATDIERRRSPRCAIDFFVQEVLADRTFLHPAINLSPDGIYILAADDRRAIDGDQTLRLEFTLPTGRLIAAGGRVTRVDDRRGQRGIGIGFEGLSAEDRSAIEAYIDEVDAVRGRAAGGAGASATA